MHVKGLRRAAAVRVGVIENADGHQIFPPDHNRLAKT
jgi:hypothetical protein